MTNQPHHLLILLLLWLQNHSFQLMLFVCFPQVAEEFLRSNTLCLTELITLNDVFVFAAILPNHKLIHRPSLRSGEVDPLKRIQLELVAPVLHTCQMLTEYLCDSGHEQTMRPFDRLESTQFDAADLLIDFIDEPEVVDEAYHLLYAIGSTRSITFLPAPQSFDPFYSTCTPIFVLQLILFVLIDIYLNSVQGDFSQWLSSIANETSLVGDAELEFLSRAGWPAILLHFEILSAPICHHSLLRQRNSVLDFRLSYLLPLYRLRDIQLQHPRVALHFLDSHTRIGIIQQCLSDKVLDFGRDCNFRREINYSFLDRQSQFLLSSPSKRHLSIQHFIESDT